MGGDGEQWMINAPTRGKLLPTCCKLENLASKLSGAVNSQACIAVAPHKPPAFWVSLLQMQQPCLAPSAVRGQQHQQGPSIG